MNPVNFLREQISLYSFDRKRKLKLRVLSGHACSKQENQEFVFPDLIPISHFPSSVTVGQECPINFQYFSSKPRLPSWHSPQEVTHVLSQITCSDFSSENITKSLVGLGP